METVIFALMITVISCHCTLTTVIFSIMMTVNFSLIIVFFVMMKTVIFAPLTTVVFAVVFALLITVAFLILIRTFCAYGLRVTTVVLAILMKVVFAL